MDQIKIIMIERESENIQLSELPRFTVFKTTVDTYIKLDGEMCLRLIGVTGEICRWRDEDLKIIEVVGTAKELHVIM